MWAQELIAALFKSKNWAYEDEWRYIKIGDIRCDFYTMQKPSAIYFGARYADNTAGNKDNVEKLIQLANKLKINKYKIKLSNQEFKMIDESFS